MDGLGELPLFARAAAFGERIAVADEQGDFTYGELLDAAAAVAARLQAGGRDLAGARVAFWVPPSFAWVAVAWGIWRAGGIAVPLALAQALPELEFTLSDTGAAVLIGAAAAPADLRPLALKLGIAWYRLDELFPRFSTGSSRSATELPPAGPELAAAALILYTSGTTGKPKGVVLTHGNIQAQVECLVAAWAWSADDRILAVLPLHHVHGIINVLTCALWSGATCEILPRFDAEAVWARLLRGGITLFMAVPTIYARLIGAWEAAAPAHRELLTRAAQGLRLMVSGSAALPVPVLERWREISGHVLLERYGMTEIGMALSNPLRGPRLPGTVGSPLPGVLVRLVDEQGELVPEGVPGQLEIRGPAVFPAYWQRPDATRSAFREGWFQSGDLAVCTRGIYRILGRLSVDILKTGGEKVSALEIEDVLRQHPAIADCAVVGVPDPEWGERVAVAVVLQAGVASAELLTLETLRQWARERLAIYKVPSRLLICPELPRNALGKVIKPTLVQWFAPP